MVSLILRICFIVPWSRCFLNHFFYPFWTFFSAFLPFPCTMIKNRKAHDIPSPSYDAYVMSHDLSNVMWRHVSDQFFLSAISYSRFSDASFIACWLPFFVCCFLLKSKMYCWVLRYIHLAFSFRPLFVVIVASLYF